MSLFVVRTGGALNVVLAFDGSVSLLEPTQPPFIVLDAPADFELGVLDYSQSGNPLFETT